MACKMSQEFPTTSLNITEDFHILHSAYVYICYSILKAKTYNWLPNTHTHTWPATTTNKKQLGTSHLLLMVISLAQTLLLCVKFRLLRAIRKDIILPTLDWLWGRLQALLQRWNVSSVHVRLANGTKWMPSQNWGTYYQSCLYPTNSAWLAFLMPFLLLLPVSGHRCVSQEYSPMLMESTT